MKKFKKIIIVLFSLICFSSFGHAAKKSASPFSLGKKFLKQGNYEKAASIFYSLVKKKPSKENRVKYNYYLARSLYRLKLDQSAALRFLKVVKGGQSAYYEQSLGSLFDLSEKNDSESFMKFSIKKLREVKSKKNNSQKYHYRNGELYSREGKYREAEKALKLVTKGFKKYKRALYLLGVVYAEQGKLKESISTFNKLSKEYKGRSVADNNRGLATIALARVSYQNKEWEKASDYYRDVPKDSDHWAESLFELSWAQFRKGDFRQVLGNLSSLHSSFYEDYFYPESILLRSLVYLSICRTDETKKTLSFFKELYSPMRAKLIKYLDNTESYTKIYEDTKKVVALLGKENISEKEKKKVSIPIPIIRELMKDKDLSVTFNYIKSLRREKKQLKRRSSKWRNSFIGKEILKFISKRVDFAKRSIGKKLQVKLVGKRREFARYYRQIDFIRYEMRAEVKKKAREDLQGKKVQKNKSKKIDFDLNRSFYLSKGIEYWPFEGEYWLDEIGNYQFLGLSSCVGKKL